MKFTLGTYTTCVMLVKLRVGMKPRKQSTCEVTCGDETYERKSTCEVYTWDIYYMCKLLVGMKLVN